VLGTLVDMAPSILIATPILLPVMQNFGVDPVHFWPFYGMMFFVLLGTYLPEVSLWLPRHVLR
jgi:TRAP-type C4-dicarboxylate transport system permease large subunit